MKLRLAFFSLGLLVVAASAVASNESCPTCLASHPITGIAATIDPLAGLTASLAALQLANVAPLTQRYDKKMEFPKASESRYLEFAPNPPEVKLPGEFDPNSVDPTFHSAYWNWKAPSYTQWLPQVWGPMLAPASMTF